jgi:hypothetical protein
MSNVSPENVVITLDVKRSTSRKMVLPIGYNGGSGLCGSCEIPTESACSIPLSIGCREPFEVIKAAAAPSSRCSDPLYLSANIATAALNPCGLQYGERNAGTRVVLDE